MHIMCLQSFARTQNSRSLLSYCISALQLEFLVALQGILCSSVATTTMEPFLVLRMHSTCFCSDSNFNFNQDIFNSNLNILKNQFNDILP